jgi:hypothetical protein
MVSGNSTDASATRICCLVYVAHWNVNLIAVNPTGIPARPAAPARGEAHTSMSYAKAPPARQDRLRGAQRPGKGHATSRSRQPPL